MLNIYLKVTIEKNWRFQNIWFSKFKKFVRRSVFGELQLTQISLNFKTSSCNLKIRGLEAKLCEAFSIILIRNYDVLESKSPCILLNKNINFNKNETIENPTDSLRETNLVL